MITKEKMLCSAIKIILSTNYLRKCMEISMESLYVDIGFLKG